jgi:hypothetical protein
MKMQELEITIGTDGRVVVHVQGTQGQECTELTKALEQAVGTVEDRTFSPEYYEEPVSDHSGIRIQK